MLKLVCPSSLTAQVRKSQQRTSKRGWEGLQNFPGDGQSQHSDSVFENKTPIRTKGVYKFDKVNDTR